MRERGKLLHEREIKAEHRQLRRRESHHARQTDKDKTEASQGRAPVRETVAAEEHTNELDQSGPSDDNIYDRKDGH